MHQCMKSRRHVVKPAAKRRITRVSSVKQPGLKETVGVTNMNLYKGNYLLSFVQCCHTHSHNTQRCTVGANKNDSFLWQVSNSTFLPTVSSYFSSHYQNFIPPAYFLNEFLGRKLLQRKSFYLSIIGYM